MRPMLLSSGRGLAHMQVVALIHVPRGEEADVAEAAQAALAEGLQAPAQVVMDPIHIRSVVPCALTGTDPIQLEVELEGAQPEDRPLLWAQGQSPPFGTAARVRGWEHHWDSPARLVISIGPGLAATPICLHLAMVRGSGAPGSLTEVRSLPRLPPEEARELRSLPPESATTPARDSGSSCSGFFVLFSRTPLAPSMLFQFRAPGCAPRHTAAESRGRKRGDLS